MKRPVELEIQLFLSCHIYSSDLLGPQMAHLMNI